MIVDVEACGLCAIVNVYLDEMFDRVAEWNIPCVSYIARSARLWIRSAGCEKRSCVRNADSQE